MEDHRRYLLVLIIFVAPLYDVRSQTSDDKNKIPLDIPDLITFWDFQHSSNESDLTSHGPYHYTLEEMNGRINEKTTGDLVLPAWK